MTLHKLSAGSGYEYLTRQVAALDSTEKRRITLADYYSARGESPGRWVGSGLAGIDCLDDGDVVTAEQMELLFGTGSHPLSGEPLGTAYKVYDNSGVDGFNIEVTRRIESLAEESGRPGKLGPSPAVLARVRSEVAWERFISEHDREPANARELSDALRRYSRPRQTAGRWVMSCAVCGNGERVPATKPYAEEKDGRIAVVTGVPVTLCESCGETWLDAPVAHALDALLTEMLSHDTLGVRAYAASTTAA